MSFGSVVVFFGSAVVSCGGDVVPCGGAVVRWWCCGHGSAVVFCGSAMVVVEEAIAVVVSNIAKQKSKNKNSDCF